MHVVRTVRLPINVSKSKKVFPAEPASFLHGSWCSIIVCKHQDINNQRYMLGGESRALHSLHCSQVSLAEWNKFFERRIMSRSKGNNHNKLLFSDFSHHLGFPHSVFQRRNGIAGLLLNAACFMRQQNICTCSQVQFAQGNPQKGWSLFWRSQKILYWKFCAYRFYTQVGYMHLTVHSHLYTLQGLCN